jgi:hypothetical protein
MRTARGVRLGSRPDVPRRSRDLDRKLHRRDDADRRYSRPLELRDQTGADTRILDQGAIGTPCPPSLDRFGREFGKLMLGADDVEKAVIAFGDPPGCADGTIVFCAVLESRISRLKRIVPGCLAGNSA